MSLTTCWKCLKYIVMLINLIFWLAGIAILAVALWIYFDSTQLLRIVKDHHAFFLTVYILIGVGCVMAIVGFLGCCGALKESQCMLASFFIFILLILVAQIGSVAWSYMNRDTFQSVVEDHVKETIQFSYTDSSPLKEPVDSLQEKLRCCGAQKPADWAKSVFNGYKPQESVIGAVVHEVVNTVTYRVPQSCCANEVCRETGGVEIAGIGGFTGSIHERGCVDAMTELLKRNMFIILGVIGGVVLIEILGMVFSMLLCCAVRRVDYMKA